MKQENQSSISPTQEMWIGTSLTSTLEFATKHFLSICHDAINKNGSCHIALSGGSTPKAIFERLAKHPDRKAIDWSRVFLYFSDERSVEPTNADSNYHMAMHSGLQTLKVPSQQIFRMQAESEIEKHAEEYEAIITSHVPDHRFDLVMLGVGEDGHTASLFPGTKGLKEQHRLVIANHIPQKDTWRMTFTFKLINHAKNIAIYSLGERKQEIIKEIFITHKNNPIYPSQKVGNTTNKALWILDNLAASPLLKG